MVTAPTIKLDTADDIAYWLGVSPHAIRMWARRGHIRRFPGDRYNGLDVADYLDGRSDLNKRRACRKPPELSSLSARDASPETG